MIVAMEAHGGIGFKGDLPWPKDLSDLRFFRDTTLGHKVAMGRKTWESIRSKPLPDRENIVVSSKMRGGKGYRVVKNPKDILEEEGVVFIIGGVSMYKAFAGSATTLHITRISGHYTSDTFFPQKEVFQHPWKLLSESYDNLGNINYLYKKDLG